MEREKTAWKKAAEFHGHVCVGLTIGYKVAQIALKALEETRAPDEELIAVVENDACGIDAIMVLTGCTPGKGNLIYKDTGKQVYTFGSRHSNRAIRIAVNGDIFERSPEDRELQRKVIYGTASDEERAEFEKKREQNMTDLFNMPADVFAKVTEVEFTLPGKARLFNSIKCSACGEYAMEPRTRNQGGQVVCLDCFEDYTRTVIIK